MVDLGKPILNLFYGNKLTLYAVFVSLFLFTLFSFTSSVEAALVPVVQDTANSSSTKKTIKTDYMRTWQQSDGRYGLSLVQNGTYMIYSQDSAFLNIIEGSTSFPSSSRHNYSGFGTKGTLVSFDFNNKNEIEHVRNIGNFRVTLRTSLVNTTATGAYMKQEVEMTNISSAAATIGASFNMDTAIAGNDSSPFLLVDGGWIGYSGSIQAYAFYNEMMHVTPADYVYLGRYNTQSPKLPSSYVAGTTISPGDSGAGFYYSPKSIAPGATRKESFIMGMGPRNTMPTLTLSSPSNGLTYSVGEQIPIKGIVNDEDLNDTVDVYYSVDNGATTPMSSLAAPVTEKNFSGNYTVPISFATGGTHTLKVWALDENGGSTQVATRTFHVTPLLAPNAPTFSSITSNSFTVSFTDTNVSGTRYELYETTQSKLTSLGTQKSMQFTGLTPNTSYSYKARALHSTANAYSAYSNLSSTYTLANTPLKSTALNASTNASVTADWLANSNPTGTNYVIEVRDGSTVVQTKNTTSLTTTFTGLPTNKNLSVYAKAVNYSGISTSYVLLGDFYQDTTPPTATSTLSPSEWTAGDVTIRVVGSDDSSGVASIKKPDGSTVSTDITTYKVSENGTYTFVIYDNNNNSTTYPVTVSNIDTTPPKAPTITLDTLEWTIPTLNFVVTSNGDYSQSGVRDMYYRINGGTWQRYTSKVAIPSNLEGIIKIEAKAIDNVDNESTIMVAYGKIDNIPPVIDKFEKQELANNRAQVKVSAHDNETALHAQGYKYSQRIIGRDTAMSDITSWISSYTYTIPATPSATIYGLKASIRDLKYNQTTSDTIYHLAAPILSYSGIKDGTYANTATFEFENPVGENVEILVYRQDEYVAKIDSGESIFVDNGLNYEQVYDYRFVAQAVDKVPYGALVSKPIAAKISVGKPQLEMSIPDKQYKTIFSDEYVVKGDVSYRKGGNISLKVYDGNSLITTGNVEIEPIVRKSWKLLVPQTTDSQKSYRLDADIVGFENSGLYKRSYNFTVSTVNPFITTLDVNSTLAKTLYTD